MGNSESSHVIHVSCQSDRYQARSDGNPNESYIGIVVFTRLVLKEWQISQELQMLSHVALYCRMAMNDEIISESQKCNVTVLLDCFLRLFFKCLFICLCHCIFVGQVMSLEYSDQMSQRSQV